MEKHSKQRPGALLSGGHQPCCVPASLSWAAVGSGHPPVQGSGVHPCSNAPAAPVSASPVPPAAAGSSVGPSPPSPSRAAHYHSRPTAPRTELGALGSAWCRERGGCAGFTLAKRRGREGSGSFFFFRKLLLPCVRAAIPKLAGSHVGKGRGSSPSPGFLHFVRVPSSAAACSRVEGVGCAGVL